MTQLLFPEFRPDWSSTPTNQLSPEPPAQRHSVTSVAAAKEIEPKAATLRRAVLDYLRGRTDGATDEEIQDGLPIPPSSQRPRRCELVEAGANRETGRKGVHRERVEV